MEETLDLHKKYQMLIYLAERGRIVNQLKVCSSLWDELLEAPYKREEFRFLRIELRRLRSALALVEPLLPEEGKCWLEQLKLRSNQLGNVRDYDVALQACTKYEAYVLETFGENSQGPDSLLAELPRLKAILLKERELRTEVLNTNVRSGCIDTELNSCVELLKKPVDLCLEAEAKSNAFLQSSLQIWGLKLCNKLQNLEKLNTMNQLHKLRIKVKRFRFAYEVYMGKDADEELLQSLKKMQDILGSLHDNDRNFEIISELLDGEEIDEPLNKEVVCFNVWREIKKQQRLEQLQPAALQLLAILQLHVVGAELL